MVFLILEERLYERSWVNISLTVMWRNVVSIRIISVVRSMVSPVVFTVYTMLFMVRPIMLSLMSPVMAFMFFMMTHILINSIVFHSFNAIMMVWFIVPMTSFPSAVMHWFVAVMILMIPMVVANVVMLISWVVHFMVMSWLTSWWCDVGHVVVVSMQIVVFVWLHLEYQVSFVHIDL